MKFTVEIDVEVDNMPEMPSAADFSRAFQRQWSAYDDGREPFHVEVAKHHLGSVARDALLAAEEARQRRLGRDRMTHGLRWATNLAYRNACYNVKRARVRVVARYEEVE